MNSDSCFYIFFQLTILSIVFSICHYSQNQLKEDYNCSFLPDNVKHNSTYTIIEGQNKIYYNTYVDYDQKLERINGTCYINNNQSINCKWNANQTVLKECFKNKMLYSFLNKSDPWHKWFHTPLNEYNLTQYCNIIF